MKTQIRLFKALSTLGVYIRATSHDLRHYKARCYVSGAITSRLNTVEESFECARDFAFIAQRVRKMGFIAVVPLGMCPASWPWKKIMRHVVWKMLLCRSVYFMDNWKTSKGCRIEHFISVITFKKRYYERTIYTLAK